MVAGLAMTQRQPTGVCEEAPTVFSVLQTAMAGCALSRAWAEHYDAGPSVHHMWKGHDDHQGNRDKIKPTMSENERKRHRRTKSAS
jgi:hypothetical protein